MRFDPKSEAKRTSRHIEIEEPTQNCDPDPGSPLTQTRFAPGNQRGLQMKNLTKLFLGAVSLLGVGSAPALAQDAPQFSLAGSVAVTSDYKFRGISQNDREPSPQGSLMLTGPEGFYVSAWASTVDFDPTNSGNPYVDQFIHGRAEGPIKMEVRA